MTFARGLMPPEPVYDGNNFNPNWSKEDHPIVNVSWEDIAGEDGKGGFCAWASEVSGIMLTLPSEAQWEKAARGVDGREFPWGVAFDTSKLWCSKVKYGDAGGTSRVGRFPSGASPYCCLDMAGNVWEWCLDWYADDFYGSRLAEGDDPVNVGYGKRKFRVLRGGSAFGDDVRDFRCAHRGGGDPSVAGSGYGRGFRLRHSG